MPPVILYIRHGHDAEEDEVRYCSEHGRPVHKPRHDPYLSRRAQQEAAALARALIQRHGHPTTVYCSPFLRTRETLRWMSSAFERPVRVVIEPRLSRFFARDERRNPSMAPSTWNARPPVAESKQAFRRRVIEHYEEVVHNQSGGGRMDTKAKSGRYRVVWCITHALPMRTVAKRVNRRLSKTIPFFGWFAIAGDA